MYSDSGYYELQKERVFARSWQWIGESAKMRAPSHLLPVTLLEGCLDEPLLLASDEAATLRCLSNVCTHRGAIIAEGESHARTLRCRYHGRRFGLDGKMQSMPEFESTIDFPSSSDDLRQLKLGTFGPLLFSGIDPAMSFDQLIEPVLRYVDWMPLDTFRRDPRASHDFLIEANWALYCDNYLEEFHIPYVHAGLSGKLDYANYRTDRFAFCNLQLGIASTGEPAFELPAGHPNSGERVAAFYFWLYPNTMLNFYPWGLSLNVVTPLAVNRTRVSFHSYVWREELRDNGVGSNLHSVEMEDEEIVESVQRGVRSRIYDRGRYSERREVGTHHFHELLARFMFSQD